MGLALRSLRALALAGPPGFVSAASGLVATPRQIAVVADDELALALFDCASTAPGTLHPLLGGELPTAPAERKAAKPDFEALLALPPDTRRPHGALLALGSGSRPNRSRGAWVALDAGGALAGSARSVDLAPLHALLRGALADELNLEGALIAGGELLLLQRAHRERLRNTILAFDASAFVAWLDGGALPALQHLRHVDLGAIAGVPLGFTDGAALPGGRWVFSAAAEDTADAYADGASVGSVLGLMGADGRVLRQHALTSRYKIEGVTIAAQRADAVDLLLVTDADDRCQPAQLLAATLPL